MRVQFIDPIEKRLNRAKEQIFELEKDIVRWLEQNPIKFKIEYRENQFGYNIYREELDTSSLSSFGFKSGECIHNMRSSLDILAFALAKIKCDPPEKTSTIYFPIFTDEDKFNSKLRILNFNFTPEVVNIMRNIQPFQRKNPGVIGEPENDPLAILSLLSNIDKHRSSISAEMTPAELEKNIQVKFATPEDAAMNCPPKVIFHGIQPGLIMEYRTNKPIELTNFDLNLKAHLVIRFEDKGEVIPDILSYIYSYIHLVVNEFRKFL
ncbi:Uncharacterised protein [Legionella busanensis]|uniref:Uncharacterized protein n=1 Tax=Legionella busanensis TaxID=190655 RepID=A0A378KAF5_9GAMM|nr:hypothetical protein [Legionella busanensis]STX81696.1 Uncharacterised protein [Legionella busanensis]